METDHEKKDGRPRTVIVFFFFGLLSMVYDEIALISAQDILSGSNIATTTVVLSIATSVLTMKLSVPWVMQSVPYLVKVVVIVALLLSGLLTLVCSCEIVYRLLGISIMEAGVSISEITFMSMTAFYDPVTASALVAGIGMSSLVGPLYYVALTTWLDWSPRTTMALTGPWPLFYFLLYALLNKEPIAQSRGKDLKMTHKKVDGEAVGTLEESENISQNDANDLTKRLATAMTISPFIFFLFVTYFSEYLANHAVITTLAFPSNTISPRDHYPYYMLTYHIGKFLGRSHIFLITCYNPGLLKYVLIKRTWVLALISFLHLVLFLLMSWYRFVGHISLVIILCITEGFTAGSMYVNSVHAVTEAIGDVKQKEFALGLLTVGDATGKLLAGVTGLWHEPLLKKHCLEDLKLGMYCFTRHTSKKGWTSGNQ
ncbi:hypothetical protein QZH41_002560 [Actinostola sp. cb2023]|nr:hypothetical protein QZH41_002560 [Actinostola sp. cb2023]